MGAIACASGFGEVGGTDIVERFLRFARLNATLNHVDVDFHHSDVEGTFDMVIANTPCVWDDAEAGAPRTFVAGGDDSRLELPGRMLVGARDRLCPGGVQLAVSSASVLGRCHYGVPALCRICDGRPSRAEPYPLLKVCDVRNRRLYRRYGVSTTVRYLAVVRPDVRWTASIERGDRARLAGDRARTLPAQAIEAFT